MTLETYENLKAYAESHKKCAEDLATLLEQHIDFGRALDYVCKQLEMEYFEKGILKKAEDIRKEAIEKAYCERTKSKEVDE